MPSKDTKGNCYRNAECCCAISTTDAAATADTITDATITAAAVDFAISTMCLGCLENIQTNKQTSPKRLAS